MIMMTKTNDAILVKCDLEKINFKHESQMLSIVVGIEIKTVYPQDCDAFLFFCSTFETSILPWASLTQTVPIGPKNQYNTRVKLKVANRFFESVVCTK